MIKEPNKANIHKTNMLEPILDGISSIATL
jgi:hypothetical protein